MCISIDQGKGNIMAGWGRAGKKPRRGAGSGPRYDIGILGVFWKSLAVIKGKGRFQGNDCKW